MFIKKNELTKDNLGPELTAIYEQRADKTLYVRADQSVPYGRVIEAMAIAKAAGATKLSMITKPPEEK
jgi:biopolymer transport protein TolR